MVSFDTHARSDRIILRSCWHFFLHIMRNAKRQVPTFVPGLPNLVLEFGERHPSCSVLQESGNLRRRILKLGLFNERQSSKAQHKVSVHFDSLLCAFNVAVIISSQDWINPQPVRPLLRRSLRLSSGRRS